MVTLNPRKQDKIHVTARYLDCSLKEAYRSYPNSKSLCFSTFCKYMEKRYKKPCRLTDMCRYCEYGFLLKKKILEPAIERNYIQNAYDDDEDLKYNINTKSILEFFKNSPEKDESSEILLNLEELLAIQFHRKIAKIQRDAYNKMRKDVILLKDSILIDLDFKQKIVVGQSPRQVNMEYFSQITKSLLGKDFDRESNF